MKANELKKFRETLETACKAAKKAAEAHVAKLLGNGPKYTIVNEIGFGNTNVVGELHELCGFFNFTFTGNRSFVSAFKKVATKSGSFHVFETEDGTIYLWKNSCSTGHCIDFHPAYNGPMSQGMGLKKAANLAGRDAIAEYCTEPLYSYSRLD